MEGLDILVQGLLLAVQEVPLPFVRRTVLEFVLPGKEGLVGRDQRPVRGLSNKGALPGSSRHYGIDQLDLQSRSGAIKELTLSIRSAKPVDDPMVLA